MSSEWIRAAFTPEHAREPWMREVLATSDELVAELMAADVIVAGVPMYNFGPPAQFKAYIDNIVRVGKTFGFTQSCDIAVEYDEFGDERLLASIEKAEQDVDRLVARLTRSGYSASDHAAA